MWGGGEHERGGRGLRDREPSMKNPAGRDGLLGMTHSAGPMIGRRREMLPFLGLLAMWDHRPGCWCFEVGRGWITKLHSRIVIPLGSIEQCPAEIS